MRVSFIGKLKPIIDSPITDVVVGLIFLYTGISETLEQLRELEHPTIGAHHGVIIFATVYILKALPELVEGIEHLTRHAEKETAE